MTTMIAREPSQDILEIVVDVADRVHQRLGPRTSVDQYETEFVDEIGSRGVEVSRRQATTLSLNGTPAGTYLADVLLENDVMVEFKQMRAITTDDLVRFARFLRSLGCRRGMIINLSAPELDYRCLNVSED